VDMGYETCAQQGLQPPHLSSGYSSS
jgi:hypothetical protein